MLLLVQYLVDGRDTEQDLGVMLPVVDESTHLRGREQVQMEAGGKDLGQEYHLEDPDTIVTETGPLLDHV